MHKYKTDFEWARALPMALRSEVHETLLLLFAKDGALPACICNNAKEMIQGKFYQKLKNAACLMKWLKPYTPRSKAAEREVIELKKGAGHEFLQFRAPKCLWEKT